MKTPLFRTKIYQPVTRTELVERPRLFNQLMAGLSSKLILVSAPAGYGKTTLLSAWAASTGLPVAWLSLDEHDNDPERFLAYLTAAFQSIGACPDLDFLQPGAGTLQSFQLFQIEDLLPVLIDRLDSWARPFVLILDDYHVIKNPEIHKAVAFLIEYQPPNMHMTITTREDPLLPVSRLRARGQLTELRQADLRFSTAETAAFLSQWGNLELPAQDVAVLAGRTEGWVAGLQMATLALQSQRTLESTGDLIPNRDEISRLIASFGGGHEYIVDYFSAEVFAQQPDVVKTFLLQTSILDELCGPLCEAVTGQSEGQQMLERLQKANLFVIALDQERYWFRYHHLFCDLLRKQLKQQSPELLPELHKRASCWYEEQGMINQACQHAQAAGDQERLGWIIDEYSEVLWIRGEFTRLLQWINALTPGQLEDRGEIGIAKAIIIARNGDYETAEQYLVKIDQMLTQKLALIVQVETKDRSDQLSGQDRFRKPGHLLGIAAAAHSIMAVLKGDPLAVLSYAQQALDILSNYTFPEDVPWKCQILVSMGDAYLLIGDLPAASAALAEAIRLGKAYHHDALLLESLTKLSIAHWLQGNLNQSEQACREGLDYISQNNLGDMPIAAGLLIAWGWIQTERSELDSALDFLLKGLHLSRSFPQQPYEFFANTALLRCWLAKGNRETAEAFLWSAEQLAQKKVVPAWLDTMLSGMKLLLWLKQDRFSEVEQELQVRGIYLAGEIRYPDQPLHYALARLSLARADTAAAVQALDPLFVYAQAAGQSQWLLLIWITRALIFLQQQNTRQGLEALARAVELAARETYIQVFLDEGEPIARLLDELAHQQPGIAYSERLREAFTRKLRAEPAERLHRLAGESTAGYHLPNQTLPRERTAHPEPESESARGGSSMLEPLSARELEILNLIAEGLSNQQIAQRLYLTIRTVKFHTSNIFRKLDVDRRTEAVARARQLRFIP